MNEDIVSKTKIILILILTFPLYSSNALANNQILISDSQNTRTTDWILDLQDNDLNNTQWYYDHLTDNDRKNIRLALDWAIPRQYIIDNMMEGLGIPTVSDVSPYASPIMNDELKPRTFNLTKAADLLTQVFGYRFNQYTNNTSTAYDESRPYFKMTLYVPINMPERIAYASEIKLLWQQIGVKVDLADYDIYHVEDYFSWDTNKNFDHGGFDAAFVAVTYPSNIPFGMQQFLGLDPTLNNYIKTSLGLNWNANITKRDQSILKYQQWIYDNVPISFIYRQLTVNAKNENLLGFNPFTQFNYENWTYPGKDSIVIAMSANWVFQNLNPIFNFVNQLDIYSDEDAEAKYSMGSLFRGMFFSTTEEQDNSFTQWKTYPYFANWYNTSADGKIWFVNLKEGLKWHDGVDLNASDVEFTFNSILQNSTSLNEFLHWDYSNLVKSLTVYNSTLIKFEFKKTWVIKETVLSTTILPKHILENIPLSEWPNDSTNTGNGSIIGNGPYTFVNASGDFNSINLKKWDYWNDSYNSLIKNNKMGEPVPGVTVPSINNLKFIIDYYGSDIVNGIKNGSIDIRLGNYIWWKDYTFVNEIASPVELISFPSMTTQQLNYNLYSPIWGYSPEDPSTIYNETVNIPPTDNSESSSVTPTSDFDFFGFFSAVVVIAIISAYSKRKKLP